MEEAHFLTAILNAPMLGEIVAPDPNVRLSDSKLGPEYLARKGMVRLEGFEPPTLGSVGTFHSQQLGDFLENRAQIVRRMFTDVHGCSTR
jgi:hypothetical protein